MSKIEPIEHYEVYPGLTKRELATVLAALRFWQANCEDFEVEALTADHFYDTTPLTADEIDALCERINTGG